MHGMVKRAREKQPVIAAMLQRRRDLTYLQLELNCTEWCILEDVAEALEPYKDVITYLSSESYLTISALGPYHKAIQDKYLDQSMRTQLLFKVYTIAGC